MRYVPVPSVTALRVFSISAGLAASTVTPGRMAPEASFTTPVMEAWANATAGTSTSSASAANPTCNFLMHNLPSFDSRSPVSNEPTGCSSEIRRQGWKGGQQSSYESLTHFIYRIQSNGYARALAGIVGGTDENCRPLEGLRA